MQEAIRSILKISLQMNVENIFANKTLGHLAKEPTEPVIGLNVKVRIVKAFIT
jgi:hypothetical protein